MSVGPEQEPSQRRESPELVCELPEITLSMNWQNTLLRYFDEGDGMFDHIAYRLEDGSYLAFTPSETLHEQLKAEGFPRRHDIVDEPTIRWFIQGLEKDLDNHDF
jgi:hypothetical protein